MAGARNRSPRIFRNRKTQGLGKYKNRTTGVSSVAGKFASSFALGAEVLPREILNLQKN